jgi:integrase
MVEIQQLTGMRPGEVCRLTTGQIDRSGEVWIYSPVKHKTVDLGKGRHVAIGPRAQEILTPWLRADPDAPLFQPVEAMRYEHSHRGDGTRIGKKRKKNPRRAPGLVYSAAVYRHAVARACRRAGVPAIHPNRLRHTFATRTRKEFGLEHAQTALGHSKADVTQVYAERDLQKAVEVARQIG